MIAQAMASLRPAAAAGHFEQGPIVRRNHGKTAVRCKHRRQRNRVRGLGWGAFAT